MKKSCPSQFVEQLFQNYAHKCNCNEAIEFRTKIVHRLKTSSIKLTSVFVDERREKMYILQSSHLNKFEYL